MAQGKIRRVITGHDANGKAIVLEDGSAPAVTHQSSSSGAYLRRSLADERFAGRDRARRSRPDAWPEQIHPPAGGTVFRISEVPPETEATRNITPEQAQAAFRHMGNEQASTFSHNRRHPFMHRTESVDYAVVLEGEITMLLDDSEVHLKTGDVVIQRGTNHAWSNRSGSPVKMLYVLIDGEFDEELETQLGQGGR